MLFYDIIGEKMYDDLGKKERQGGSSEQRSCLINATGLG